MFGAMLTSATKYVKNYNSYEDILKSLPLSRGPIQLSTHGTLLQNTHRDST